MDPRNKFMGVLEVESDDEEHAIGEFERYLVEIDGHNEKLTPLGVESLGNLTCSTNIEKPHPQPGPVNSPPTALATPKNMLFGGLLVQNMVTNT